MARRTRNTGTPGVVGSMTAPSNVPPPTNMVVTGRSRGRGPRDIWIGYPFNRAPSSGNTYSAAAGPFYPPPPYGWRGTPPVGGGGTSQGRRTAWPVSIPWGRNAPPGVTGHQVWRSAAGDPRNMTKEDWGRGGAMRGPWLATHGWRTAPPVVKGTIDQALGEISGGRGGAMRGPWLLTHGWRTAPPVVKAQVDQAMMDIATECLASGGGGGTTSTFPQRLRGKYGSGFGG